jgi:hypothetical protein
MDSRGFTQIVVTWQLAGVACGLFFGPAMLGGALAAVADNPRRYVIPATILGGLAIILYGWAALGIRSRWKQLALPPSSDRARFKQAFFKGLGLVALGTFWSVGVLLAAAPFVLSLVGTVLTWAGMLLIARAMVSHGQAALIAGTASGKDLAHVG